ncbi:MAG: TonB-dependent receptor [Flavobacteriales bacterium]|nr:TonB-dependent receptor [Flavobacteriales bacterium]
MPTLRAFFLSVLIASPLFFSAQEKFTISGEIKDKASGEYLIGAVIGVKELQKGVSTNVYGFYSLTLPAGSYTLDVYLLGYVDKQIEISLDKDITLALALDPQTYEAEEVIVEAEKKQNTESTDMGRAKLEVDQIKKLPAFMGEVDILKTLALLPGVRSAGEGNTGFYVRGGGIDQNLVLLDNATVYNASHLFGFFSVFNADAVKNLELIKGGVPANYGSRISSVLDIALKEGNNREFHGEGGIGLISSRFTVEGPIQKDISSFILSGRRTYIDVLSKPFINPEADAAGSAYYFYDLNAKLNYRISTKDQLFLSGYFGRDVFGFKSQNADFSSEIPWGNATATLRWNRIMNPKLFMNAILTFTDYKFEFIGEQSDLEFRLKSGIRDYGAKVQWNYYPTYLHQIKWGVEYTRHQFTPNTVYARSGDTEFIDGEDAIMYSHEMAAYALDEFDINEKLRFNAGVRVSHFIHVGPFKRYIYSDSVDQFNQPLPPAIVQYAKGDVVKNYTGFEPRLSLRYTINNVSSIKAGYTHNYQYIHLTSLSPTSLPTDVWIPSTEIVKPQFGIQYALGYFRNFGNDKWETSVEVYYKDMKNQTEFEEGAQPEQTVNDNVDNFLVFGKAYSYGAEFFVKKRVGRVNGWVGYTWSKTMRKFDEINNGETFPARWDRRHDGSLVVSYKLSDRIDLGFIFVYGTGSAITLPLERYFYENHIVDVYGPRNSFRMAAYHRADASLTLYPKPMKTVTDKTTGEKVEKKRKVTSNWNLSVYNLYNRKNPYFIYFDSGGQLGEGSLQIKAYQVSLFPILPSITWNFKF